MPRFSPQQHALEDQANRLGASIQASISSQYLGSEFHAFGNPLSDSNPTNQTLAPAALQRRKRWYTVIHFPYFSGTSRQGAPVRIRQRMPFTMGRLSDAGRLLRPRSGGNRSFNTCHSVSLRSPRLKNASLPRGILESNPDSGANHFVNRPKFSEQQIAFIWRQAVFTPRVAFCRNMDDTAKIGIEQVAVTVQDGR